MAEGSKVAYQVLYDENLRVVEVKRMDGGAVGELGYALEVNSITDIQVFEPLAMVTTMKGLARHCIVNRPFPRCYSC